MAELMAALSDADLIRELRAEVARLEAAHKQMQRTGLHSIVIDLQTPEGFKPEGVRIVVTAPTMKEDVLMRATQNIFRLYMEIWRSKEIDRVKEQFRLTSGMLRLDGAGS